MSWKVVYSSFLIISLMQCNKCIKHSRMRSAAAAKRAFALEQLDGSSRKQALV